MLLQQLRQAPKAFRVVAVALSLIGVACSAAQSSTRQTAPGTAESERPTTAHPSVTSQSSPYPFTTPLPPADPTILDGLYTKLDPKQGTPVPCRRCPDYAPEGGLWTLTFDKGIFRVFHTVTGWRSVGSFTVSGNRIMLFNDPTCHEEVGIYTWFLEGGWLTLHVVDDRCAISLRAMNLTNQPWASCQPPSSEAAISDHWPKPPGC
jgi:hypothetical protein